MGCGKSKHAVSTENTTTVLKKSLSSVQSKKMETNVEKVTAEEKTSTVSINNDKAADINGDGDENPDKKNEKELSGGDPVKVEEDGHGVKYEKKESSGGDIINCVAEDVKDEVKDQKVEEKEVDKKLPEGLVSEESTNQELMEEEEKEETNAGPEGGQLAVEDIKEDQKGTS